VTPHQAGPGLVLLVVLVALGYEYLSLRAPGRTRWRGAAFMAGATRSPP
jgi:hypothetical protein